MSGIVVSPLRRAARYFPLLLAFAYLATGVLGFHQAASAADRSAVLAASGSTSALVYPQQVNQAGFIGEATGQSLAGVDPTAAALVPTVHPTPGDVTPSGSRAACSGVFSRNDQLLPVNRWKDGMSFHTRLSGLGDIGSGVMKNGVMSIGLSAGNLFWSMSTGMVGFANTFCPLDYAGGVMDRAFGSLANAVLKSPLLGMLVTVLVGVYFFRVARGNGGMHLKTLFQKGLVLALLVIMSSGAARSTGGGIDGNTGGFSPGFGSPGWFVTRVDTVVRDMTGSVVNALPSHNGASSTSSTDPSDQPTYDANSPYSCESYVKSMKDMYTKAATSNGSSAAVALPRALDEYWEQSGLQAWKQAQFGSNNRYGDIMYCRMLEANSPDTAPVSPMKALQARQVDRSVSAIMKNMGVKIDPKAYAWTPSSNDTYRDRTYVGWAACAHGAGNDSTTGWTVPDNRKGIYPGNSVNSPAADDKAKACNWLFNKAGASDGEHANAFDWENGGGKINQDDYPDMTDSDANFLRTLHGKDSSSGFISIGVYMISSFLLFLVFGLFAMAVIGAKAFALVSIIGLLFAIISTLLPSTDASKVVQYARQYVGISFLAFGASLLLAILTLLTGVLIDLGNQTVPGGPGSTMAMIWTGLAPLISVVSMHYLFKKMRIPSPMNPAAAGAWGKAASGGGLGGAVGAAVGGGATAALMSKVGSRAKDQTKAVALSKLGLGKGAPSKSGDRAHDPMGPKGAPGGTEGTAAGEGAAAGAGAATEEAGRRHRAGKDERAAAENFAGTERGKEVLAEQAAAREASKLTRVERARASVTAAANRFRANPMRSLGGAALTAAKYGAAGAALAGTGPVGWGVAATAVAARKGVISKGARGVTGKVTGREDKTAKLDAYYQHQSEQAQAAQAAAVEQGKRDDAKRLAEAQADTAAGRGGADQNGSGGKPLSPTATTPGSPSGDKD